MACFEQSLFVRGIWRFYIHQVHGILTSSICACCYFKGQPASILTNYIFFTSNNYVCVHVCVCMNVCVNAIVTVFTVHKV